MSSLPVQLLRLLGGGGILSTAELARRLEISEAVVNMMAEDLTRRGYLQDLNQACSTGCAGCSLSSTCRVSPTPQAALLGLTDKGKHLAAQP